MATLKQKKAFKKTLENIGSKVAKTQGDILRESGYSDNVADTPQIVTNSKGWKELVEEYLPDDLLVKVHQEGLEATKKIFKNNNETGQIEQVGNEPDYAIRHKYLDTAYKVKGSFAPDKKDVNLTGVNLSKLFDATNNAGH